MKAVILLGGKGTRLRPLTCETPKPLLPILNKPSLIYQIGLLQKYGVRHVVFCVNYLSQKFRNYFGNGEKFGIKIDYVSEKSPLGTGGAIKNAQKFIDETTIIFNGDILTDMDLGKAMAFHRANRAVLTIALVRVKDPTIYGLVETDQSFRIRRFLEKPSWDEVTTNNINAGIYVFEPRLLDYIPAGINYSVERGLFPFLLEQKEPVYGYVAAKSYWLDIGTVEKYLQAHFDILKGEAKLPITGRKIRQNIWVEEKVSIERSAVIEGKTVIGGNTRIEQFVQISGLVSIGSDCRVKKGAVISNSVLLSGTVVGEGVRIENSVIGRNSKIEPHSIIVNGTVGDSSVITRYSKL
jgi:mannose-1-phosphate guanylyltransferase